MLAQPVSVISWPMPRMSGSMVTRGKSVILWMGEILHHLGNIGNRCSFGGGAGFRPSTVARGWPLGTQIMTADVSQVDLQLRLKDSRLRLPR